MTYATLQQMVKTVKSVDSKFATLRICYKDIGLALYIKGDYVDAFKWLEKSYQLFTDYMVAYFYNDCKILYGLCITRLYQSFDAAAQSRYMMLLRKFQSEFNFNAQYAPQNYRHLYCLLSAEIARINNDNNNAIKYFNEAISAAEEGEFLNYVALIHEICANFYAAIQNRELVTFHIKNARHYYHQWGAQAKVALLEKQYSDIFKTEQVKPNNAISTDLTDLESANSLDLLSIIKSAQTLSGEIQLERLLPKLIDILLENAGAERAVFFTLQDQQWYVESEGTISGIKVFLHEKSLMEQKKDIPLTLIRYSLRTNTPLLLHENDSKENIPLDTYLKRESPKSLLIIPVAHQGSLRSILYLENKITQSTFSQNHVRTLSLLAAQASISLENARLYHQATHDPLTGLANRNLLHEFFNLASAQASRDRKQIALLYLDLDYFKEVNDRYGHDIGDQMLLVFSQKVRECIREGDLACRLGGDEFVIMLTQVDGLNRATSLAKRLYSLLTIPFNYNGHELVISASIGISMFPKDGLTVQELLKHADFALYQAKEHGRNQFEIYK